MARCVIPWEARYKPHIFWRPYGPVVFLSGIEHLDRKAMAWCVAKQREIGGDDGSARDGAGEPDGRA